LALTAACALNPAPVPVTGAAEDINALAGEWTGEYRSVETGRSGSILFMLQSGRDTAFGDVVMVARESGMTHDDAMRVATTRRQANQVLTIRFVRVTGSTVSGTIEPYPSPDCSCQLITVFRGDLRGDRIEGHSARIMRARTPVSRDVVGDTNRSRGTRSGTRKRPIS
jgi:hypothetical protein